MMPTVIEEKTTVVSLTCEDIYDMSRDGDKEAYIELWNVTVKTSDGRETKYPESRFAYCDNPMSNQYCSLTDMDGKNSYVSRDEHDRALKLEFTQQADNSWLGVLLASPALQQAAERGRWGSARSARA
jgi:hypothetical protein